MPLTPTQALTQLRAHPTSFLRKYPLSVYGNATTASGVRQLYIMDGGFMDNGVQHRRPDSILGTLKMRNVNQTFTVALQNLGEPQTQQFAANWLKMSPWQNPNDIYNISILTLDGTGPNLMFTAVLSGCSVAVQRGTHGSLRVAHVQPNISIPNTNQQMQLDGQGVHRVLAKSGWSAVYGRNDYGHGNHTVIVGVRKTSGWKIYAQRQSGNGGFGNIRSVKTLIS